MAYEFIFKIFIFLCINAVNHLTALLNSSNKRDLKKKALRKYMI